MIENMGDANECVRELFWLVESKIGCDKAKKFLEEEYYPMLRGDMDKDESFIKVECRMEN